LSDWSAGGRPGRPARPIRGHDLAHPQPPRPVTACTLATHARLRRDTVDSSGVITLRHDSRLHHIGLGRRHAGTRVLVLVLDRHICVLNQATGHLLRELILDPTRDYYQPQPRK
jgi:hypothetical protein